MAEGSSRVGWGFDAHRFGPGGPVVLCGIVVDDGRGVEATSDGDVAAHALIDALLGAVGLGDLGTHFASDDPDMQGADSMELLARVRRLVENESYRVGNVDVTIISQSVRVAPHREAMRAALSQVLRIDVDAVSVKATSTDGMGSIGADEGIAAAAVATVYR
ncbi:MAG: hypothetical protein BMS9Abin07_2279 [Acidimicrobiia bacterium]|nr:MAG: hypothetical protein BMS9Abin07_2279 [Acidimicrobiia bacterium]